ncbi:MAG TPA: hypothetical protein VMR62_19960 [Bryobacteraceae bacterium]|jgi:hypothetical protein|nr:hypothetical protein [Bryobacteraceae bacterium]
MRIAVMPVLVTVVSLANLDAQTDVVMKAMRDEMARSMKELTVENLEKPYFISYRVVDSDAVRVAAAFGALNHSDTDHSRRLTVEVRVGDYKLDSSHFFSFDFDMGTRLRIFNGTTELCQEDDYKELRRQLWLATDSTYKKAVEDLSKKRALLKTRSRDYESDNFSREEPATTTHELPAVKPDVSQWESEARALSALFRQMPGIYTSSVSFNCFNTYTRYLTSEGASYTRREPNVTFNTDAATQAADGTPLDDFVWFQGRSLAEIPAQAELAARIQAMGHYLTELRDAGTLVNYSGPLLVEGDAAAQLVRFKLVPELLGSKRTLVSMPGGQPQNGQPGRESVPG